MNLGAAIQMVRKNRGIRQDNLAEGCDISASYLSQIENNHKEPSLSVIKVLADYLKIPVPVLFFLALDEEDVPERKKEAFEIIGPAVRAYIGDIFLRTS